MAAHTAETFMEGTVRLGVCAAWSCARTLRRRALNIDSYYLICGFPFKCSGGTEIRLRVRLDLPDQRFQAHECANDHLMMESDRP